MSKKVALLIGVSEYGEGIPSLLAPINDVAALKRVLENLNMGGFNDIKTLINPDLAAMQKGIQEIFANLCKDDLVLLFFSGHGITDDNNRLYLTTKGTSKKFYKASAVPASFIQDVSLESYAKRQVIILDCCYSGAFAEGWQTKSVGVDLEKQLGAEGRVVLTSSTATQTSFQQEGEELSLYTRYLVEGIETGAADDGDGKIYAHELHHYAKAKVQEVKPIQKPEIISDQEGYNILLSLAPINDPELNFRKFVEKYVIEGQITVAGKYILQKKRQELGINDEKSNEIINEVLAPYRKHIKNIKYYQQAFIEAMKQQYPLSNQVLSEFKDLQDVLGLEDKDIAPFQKEISEQKEAEDQQLSQSILKVTPPKIEQHPVPTKLKLLSEKGVDYTTLDSLLAARNWKEADEETIRVMCLATGRQEEESLRVEDIDNFPCKDLRTINQLWLHHSNGKFGFSVQKEIYQSLGGTRKYNREVWKKFGERVGWRVKRNLLSRILKHGWLFYSDLTFNQRAPRGHLPTLMVLSGLDPQLELPPWMRFRGACPSLEVLLSRPDL
jgi:Uncharacterized protein containing caspase domain